jgi:hypothetical protein
VIAFVVYAFTFGTQYAQQEDTLVLTHEDAVILEAAAIEQNGIDETLFVEGDLTGVSQEYRDTLFPALK